MIKDIDQKIVRATFETVAAQKISGTRMHMIAAAAGTSQSNLHYHFPTKKDMLLSVLDYLQQYFSEKRRKLVDLSRRSFRENLHALFEEKKDDILHHKEIDSVQFDYLVQGTVNPDVRRKLRATFDVWRADIVSVLRQRGAPEPGDGGVDMDARLLVSLMIGASVQAMLDDSAFDADAYFRAAEALALEGCRVEHEETRPRATERRAGSRG